MNQVKNKWVDFFQIVLCMVLVLGAQLSFSISNSSGVSGSSKVFVVELIVIAFGFYVVFINQLIRKKIRESSKLSRSIFIMLLTFVAYYVVYFIYRIVTRQSLTGSLYLARVVVETGIIFLSLDYFKVKSSNVLKGLFLVGLISSLWQIFILFTQDGVIRGSIVLGNSNVYNLFMMMIIPALIYTINHQKDNWKWLNLSVLVVSIPVILLTGSRAGFVVLLFMIIMSVLLLMSDVLVKKRILVSLGVLMYTLVSIVGINFFGSQISKNNVSRSISIPYELVMKVMNKKEVIPDEKKDYSKVDLKNSYQFNEEEYVAATAGKSNSYRKEWNGLAKDSIMRNPVNFLFGSGMSVVHTSVSGYQTPHNFILQFMLPFGLIGLIICFALIFAPLVSGLKLGRMRFLLLAMTYFPVLVISLNQPLLGNMVISFSQIMLGYSIYSYKEE